MVKTKHQGNRSIITRRLRLAGPPQLDTNQRTSTSVANPAAWPSIFPIIIETRRQNIAIGETPQQ